MSSKILIPYLRSDYNKIIEDFKIKKIKSIEKDELLVLLKNSESWLYDCYLKDQSINLFLKTGFIAIGLSDDDLFKIGVETTIMQLNKRYFFDIKKDDNILILKKVKSRIVNNIRNYFSPTRKINYQQFHNFIIQIEDFYENFEQIIFEIDLEKIDKESLKNGLEKVWQDSIGDIDFDIKDFEDLCKKFGFTPLDVLVYNPYIVPKMSKQTLNNSDYQLILIFDEKVA